MKYLNTIAKLGSLFFTSAFLSVALISKAQWAYIGDTEFSAGQATDVSMDVLNGTPYMAYTDHANLFRVTVMKYNGSGWSPVGFPAFTAPTPDPYDISFKLNGNVPYLVFVDRAFQNQGIIDAGKMTVMKFNGGIWTYVGEPGFSAGDAGIPTLVIDEGVPYVAFRDKTQGSGLVVMKFDGNNWVQIGTSIILTNIPYKYSFAVYNGIPYIAYFDKSLDYKPFVKKFDGSSWVNVGNPSFLGDKYAVMKFAMSENGTPYLAHADSSTNGSITVLQFDGTDWVSVGVPNFTPLISINRFSFTLDGETPYVVFEPFTVMRYKNAEWQLVGPSNFITGHYPNYINIVVKDGVPYLGYQHNAFGGGATAMKYIETSSSNDLLSKTDFRLYPNPSHGGEITFYLENAASDQAFLQVFDFNGKRFFEQTITLETGRIAYPVRLPDLPTGIYLTKLTTSRLQVASSKLVIMD